MSDANCDQSKFSPVKAKENISSTDSIFCGKRGFCQKRYVIGTTFGEAIVVVSAIGADKNEPHMCRSVSDKQQPQYLCNVHFEEAGTIFTWIPVWLPESHIQWTHKSMWPFNQMSPTRTTSSDWIATRRLLFRFSLTLHAQKWPWALERTSLDKWAVKKGTEVTAALQRMITGVRSSLRVLETHYTNILDSSELYLEQFVFLPRREWEH